MGGGLHRQAMQFLQRRTVRQSKILGSPPSICLDSPCGTVIVRSIKLLMCVMKAIVCYDGDVEVEDESGLSSTSG